MYKQSGIKAKETLVMLDFTYHMPVRILTGRKIVSKEGDLLRAFGKKAAVITGKSSAAKSGALADIADICTRTSVTFQVYNSVQNDPPVANVLEIAAEIKQFQPDFLIAIGGGSVIDAAKVVSYLLTNGISPETIWQKPRLSPLPLVAIPTTAGTGSEVTPYAVLTVPEDETKKSVATPLIYPKVAFLDPAYTESMPREVTINTAIDALSHLIEGFIAKRANNLSDILAIEGMELMAKALPSLPKGEFTSSCREHLLYASLFGGLTIAKTGSTLVHALGYSLTYYHGIEHGRANGLLLGAYLDYMQNAVPEKVALIVSALGFARLEEFKDYLRTLYSLNLDLSTREIALYVEKALKTSNVQNTPGEISGYVVADILERSIS